MKKKTDNAKMKKQGTAKKKHGFLIIFVCIFLVLTVAFGIFFGVRAAVKNSRAAVSFKGQTMDGEVVSFFISYYKYRYMSMLSSAGVKDVEDTPGFWRTDAGEGKTYGELLKEAAAEYIRQVMVANYLYDRYGTLSSSEKKSISDARRNLVEYKADGSKKAFDKEAEKYGFSYSSFYDACVMLYKANAAKSVIYGTSGSAIAEYPELASRYLSEYSHVKLLFIRTETDFKVDEDGNRITGNDGYYETRELTAEEKAERQAVINEIRGYIAAIGTDEDEMSPELFDYYLSHYDGGDADMHGEGYYFHKNAEFTAGFANTVSSDVVTRALAMSVGSFAEVKVDFGVCFIYKYEVTAGAYSSSRVEDCFTDFYSDAATALFEESLAAYTPDVVFNDRFYDIDIITLPYNYIYLPQF